MLEAIGSYSQTLSSGNLTQLPSVQNAVTSQTSYAVICFLPSHSFPEGRQPSAAVPALCAARRATAHVATRFSSGAEHGPVSKRARLGRNPSQMPLTGKWACGRSNFLTSRLFSPCLQHLFAFAFKGIFIFRSWTGTLQWRLARKITLETSQCFFLSHKGCWC